MIRYRNLGLILLGIALGGVPATAQERGAAPLPDTTDLALMFIVFPGEDAAQSTMNSLNQAQPAAGEQIESYAVVSRDQQGQLEVQETSPQTETPSQTEAAADDMIDGVVALLGRPRNQDQADSAAGAVGPTGISSANVAKMQEMLAPGTSAIVAVVAEPMTEQMTSQVDQADTTDSGEMIVVEMAPEE